MASKGEDPEELRLLLVGCTGSGKSATGNSILLQKEDTFKEINCHVTDDGDLAKATGDPLETGRRITVVDTPEISEKWLNSYTVKGKHFMDLVRPGPHAILLVISMSNRFDIYVQEKVKLLKKIFGEECTRYMVFIFTHVDNINPRGTNPDTFDTYFSKLRNDEYVGCLLKECSGRHVKFNNRIAHNKSEDNMNLARKEQVEPLLTMIEEMVHKNDEKFGQKYYPIENMKNSEDNPLVRAMKRFAVVAHRPAVFISSFASGVLLYHVVASLEHSFSVRLVAPFGCLLPVAAWQLYKRDQKRLNIHLFTNGKSTNNRPIMIFGFSSGYLLASLLVLGLDTLL